MTDVDAARMADRLRLVEQHVWFENHHDLEGIMGTFGASARYDDEPFGAHSHFGLVVGEHSHVQVADAIRAFLDTNHL